MVRKGMSFDEKCSKMVSIIQSSGTFYQLRELEKLGAAQGIVMQSIKEVVATILSENKIMCEKIGTSNYYWSFPETIVIQTSERISKLEEQLTLTAESVKKLDETISALEQERTDTEERRGLLQEFEELTTTVAELEEKSKSMADRDPKVIEAKEEYLRQAIDGANRWTDNLHCTLHFIKRKTGREITVAGGLLEYIKE